VNVFGGEYPKTENLLSRDQDSHKLVLGRLRHRAYEQVNEWLVTEKIDGTNIRLRLTWGGSTYATPIPVAEVLGRSDAAQLPKRFAEEALPCGLTASLGAQLFEAMKEITPGLKLTADGSLDPISGPLMQMVIYGEGYGAGIQKGGYYSPIKRLRIFDVVTGHYATSPYWRPWSDVVLVAQILGLQTVPLIYERATTDEVMDYVHDKPHSGVSPLENTDIYRTPLREWPDAEGVVARTDPYLFDSRGRRIMFKLKTRDLAGALDPTFEQDA
jgi:RNA ligase